MLMKRLVLLFCLIVTPALGWASAPEHPVSPELGLEMLIEGNQRFATGQPEYPNASPARRTLTTTNGQSPFATIIACSDSRVPVEILFDQGIGDLFVIKVAGNVADVDELGSMEYGVDHLGTPVLMVLGHTNCGAVTAVTTGAEVHGSIPQLVDNILPAVERAKKKAPEAETTELISMAITENVWEAIASILTNSHAIAERAAEGKLVVIGAVYDILSGKVELLGTHPEQASLLPGAAAALTVQTAALPAATSEQPVQSNVAHAEPATAQDQAALAEPAPSGDEQLAIQEEAPAHAEQQAEQPGHDATPTDTATAAPADLNTKAGQPSSGRFGFILFILVIGAIIVAVRRMDTKILNPEDH